MTNRFASAKVLKKGTKGGNDKANLHIEGLAEYGTIDALMKALKTLQESAKVVCDDQAAEQFVSEAVLYGRRPENFRGMDIDDVTASMELRKRASNSPLKDEEVDMLDKYEIPYASVDTFIINPAYASDGDLLEKVSKALDKVPGLPADFIQKASDTKRVVTDESLTKVFQSKDEDKIRALMPIVTVQAIKATVPNFDVMKALKHVASMIDPTKVFDFLSKEQDEDKQRKIIKKAEQIQSDRAKKNLKKNLKASLEA